jgi:predicted nucleic acid-binding protein
MVSFLDTNIVFYAATRGLSSHDRPKRALARDIVSEGQFAVSGQVLAEFYNNITKKGPAPFSHEEAVEYINLLRIRPCIPVDTDVVVHGATLAKRYDLSYWDGAIIAAAHISGAETLYSEDLNDGQLYGTVTVVNPFKSLIH